MQEETREAIEEEAQEGARDVEQAGAVEAARRARFGALPERVLPQDMVEERPAHPRDPARDAYDPDEVAMRFGL
ncbi:hypothetical protein OG352_36290 [Streptomyces sp. NBC_01485]|uniref:hypothetical protein n=1 Tax=Streptomyces sp. NBC_01485 TaxID=2903884 RepID=UPI002E34764F|nr:hypothetical protein [Streptomyces sp. NBC_01485]